MVCQSRINDMSSDQALMHKSKSVSPPVDLSAVWLPRPRPLSVCQGPPANHRIPLDQGLYYALVSKAPGWQLFLAHALHQALCMLKDLAERSICR